MSVDATPITPVLTDFYSSQTSIENVFGVNNIIRWSNLDNDNAAADTDRITSSILFAQDYINDRFRFSRYLLPFSSPPKRITDWASKWAGIWLYESRGLSDDNEEGNKLQVIKESVETEISDCIAGITKLDATAHDTTAPTSPTVIR